MKPCVIDKHAPHRKYDKAKISERWDSNGRGVSTHLARVEFPEKSKGMYFAARTQKTPAGLVVFEASYTDMGGVTVEFDLPRLGGIILPGRDVSIYARIDAPYPGAVSPTNQTQEVVFEIGKSIRACQEDVRRTLVIADPNGVDATTVAIPFGAKRFNILSTAAAPNVGRVNALAEDNTVLVNYFSAWSTTKLSWAGFSGFELPPQATKLTVGGNGGAASGFHYLVFHLEH